VDNGALSLKTPIDNRITNLYIYTITQTQNSAQYLKNRRRENEEKLA
jgi:hypothetical protein